MKLNGIVSRLLAAALGTRIWCGDVTSRVDAVHVSSMPDYSGWSRDADSSEASRRRTPCLTQEDCKTVVVQRWRMAGERAGHFYNGTFPTKGCFSKKDNFFFSLGTDEEMSTPELPGMQERLWCVSKEDEKEDENDEDADVPGSCASDSRCDEGRFCRRAAGDCSGAGVCAVRPEVCAEQYRPVCACDEKTYPNACMAHAAGVGVASENACASGIDKPSMDSPPSRFPTRPPTFFPTLGAKPVAGSIYLGETETGIGKSFSAKNGTENSTVSSSTPSLSSPTAAPSAETASTRAFSITAAPSRSPENGSADIPTKPTNNPEEDPPSDSSAMFTFRRPSPSSQPSKLEVTKKPTVDQIEGLAFAVPITGEKVPATSPSVSVGASFVSHGGAAMFVTAVLYLIY